LRSDPNQHLRMPELTRLLEEAAQWAKPELNVTELHPHLVNCEGCRNQLLSLEATGAQLESTGAGEVIGKTASCPEEQTWRQIAGGVVDGEQTLAAIEHASRCAYCGPRLRAAVGELAYLSQALTEGEREQIELLESASPEWQRRLAGRISGTPRSGSSGRA
jgi:hypothetical protein